MKYGKCNTGSHIKNGLIFIDKKNATKLQQTNIPFHFHECRSNDCLKMTELLKRIEIEKSLIVAITEVNPKVIEDHQIDLKLPNYSIHATNIINSAKRGIIVYTHVPMETWWG